MRKATARAVLTLLAGGGLCAAAHAQLPPGFDMSQIPAGVDLSKIPSGVNPSQLPAGFDPSQLPAGFDASQLPPGGDIPAGLGAYLPQAPGSAIPAQGVAIQGGGGGGAPPVVKRGGEPASKRPKYTLGVEIQQIADVQLHGAGDDVTYTEVSGNMTADVRSRRIVASGIYRLSYRVPQLGDEGKSINQNGVMRLRADIIEEWLSADAGAIVTRSRVDPSGAAPLSNIGNARNLTQTYSAFFQPSLARQMGEVGVGASYRFGYTRNEAKSGILSQGPLTNRFDSSKTHDASLQVGMLNSSLPFDWSSEATYRRDDSSSLAQRLVGYTVRGEVKVPIAATVAAVASAGYERTRSSKGQALIDPLTGQPVLSKGGGFVSDPTLPRLLIYDVGGFIADAGIIWKPSRRTRMEARVGRRYGSLSVTGLVEMRPSDRSGLTLIVSDRIETFGQGVSSSLADAPPSLNLDQSLDPGSSFQDCLFGNVAGSGECLGGTLGQASASAYRERGARFVFSRNMRKWSVSTSVGYSRRSYIDQPGTPFSLDGVVDQNFFSNLSFAIQMARNSGISFSFSGKLFKNGQVGASDVMSGSASTSYFRTFGRSIRARAELTIDATKQDGVTADVSGRAQLGLQYEF